MSCCTCEQSNIMATRWQSVPKWVCRSFRDRVARLAGAPFSTLEITRGFAKALPLSTCPTPHMSVEKSSLRVANRQKRHNKTPSSHVTTGVPPSAFSYEALFNLRENVSSICVQEMVTGHATTMLVLSRKATKSSPAIASPRVAQSEFRQVIPCPIVRAILYITKGSNDHAKSPHVRAGFANAFTSSRGGYNADHRDTQNQEKLVRAVHCLLTAFLGTSAFLSPISVPAESKSRQQDTAKQTKTFLQGQATNASRLVAKLSCTSAQSEGLDLSSFKTFGPGRCASSCYRLPKDAKVVHRPRPFALARLHIDVTCPVVV
jgi:hypothetical protein